MGSQSVKAISGLSDRKDYLYHLLNDVKALEYMIENDLFEKGIQRIGTEQERLTMLASQPHLLPKI